MAKNIMKSNSNEYKDDTSKKQKLNSIFRLSCLFNKMKNNEDTSKVLHQQDPNNILCNYYSQKNDNNKIINDFMEKINKLNKKFYISSEKFLLTKSSFEKISDELFLNLFKQIDCYVEEIQRLNKKIISIDNINNKTLIKNLTKELSENKEKIRNYEVKIKEKTMNEEKLSKELESYKRRLIFFTNKININLMARNTERNNIKKPRRESIESVNINNINISISSRKNSRSIRNQKNDLKEWKKNKRSSFSPSPERPAKLKKSYCFSAKNVIAFTPQEKEYMSIKIIGIDTIDSNNINNESNNTTINDLQNNDTNMNKDLIKNLITDNENNKKKGLFSNRETKKNKDKCIIKINRKHNQKEAIIVPLKRNYNKDDTIDNTSSKNNKKTNTNNNVKNIYINEKTEENDLTLVKNKEENENINKKIIAFNNTNSKSDNKCKTEKSDNNNKLFGINKINSNSNIRNKIKLGSKQPTFNNINSIIKICKSKEDTNKKNMTSNKLFNLPSKRSIKSNTNVPQSISTNDIEQNYNNNIKNITDLDNCKKDINNKNKRNKKALNFIKSKTEKINFKKENNSEKKPIFNFNNSDDDISINSTLNKNNFSNKNTNNKYCYLTTNNNNGNFSDLDKGAYNSINFGSGDNSFTLKKNKKLVNLKKNKIKSKKGRIINDNKNNNKNKQILNKDIMKLDLKDKDKELAKILKEMNEDYNNDIEMLKTQEEQIKLMLSLINLNGN